MSIIEQLTQDMKTAMKAREKEKLITIRGLMAALKNQVINKKRDLNEQEEIEILAREAKRRNESIEAYEKGGRDDLVAKEKAELEVISTYLPEQLSPAEVTEMLKQVVDEVGATSMRDMGKVMGKIMPQLKGRFPGKEVRPLLQAILE